MLLEFFEFHLRKAAMGNRIAAIAMVYGQYTLYCLLLRSPVLLLRSDVGGQFQPWNAAKLLTRSIAMKNAGIVDRGMWTVDLKDTMSSGSTSVEGMYRKIDYVDDEILAPNVLDV
jgi:hypothetical protein